MPLGHERGTSSTRLGCLRKVRVGSALNESYLAVRNTVS